MSNENLKATADESRLALQSVRDAQTTLVERTRAPVWLTALTVLMMAAILLGDWVLNADDLIGIAYDLIVIAFALVMASVWSAYYVYLRRKGLRLRVFPSSAAGRWFFAGQVAFFVGMILATEWLLDLGYDWASWVATVVICAGLAVILHFYPTCDLGPRIKNS